MPSADASVRTATLPLLADPVQEREISTYTIMAYIVMAYMVMAYMIMAYIVMAYTVTAYTVTAYTVMATPSEMVTMKATMAARQMVD